MIWTRNQQFGVVGGNVDENGIWEGHIQRSGLATGSCYLHDEEYKGSANTHWRGIVVLNEVRNGEFCEMALTLDYLCRRYEGRSLSSYLKRKYRNAEQRFTLARSV